MKGERVTDGESGESIEQEICGGSRKRQVRDKRAYDEVDGEK